MRITFTGKPENYASITDKVSRSAQPQKEDFFWLKERGVTDIINFRTMYRSDVSFDEQKVVEGMGLKYHNIPTYSRHPKKKQVVEFLNLVDKIVDEGGKVHIHCKAGADRTGMYSFVYKSMKNIGDFSSNIVEWMRMGLHAQLYPDLMPWAIRCVKQLKK